MVTTLAEKVYFSANSWINNAESTPSSESGGALEIELLTLFDESPTISPRMNAVGKIWIKNLHS